MCARLCVNECGFQPARCRRGRHLAGGSPRCHVAEGRYFQALAQPSGLSISGELPDD